MKRSFWIQLSLAVGIFIASQAGVYVVLRLAGLADRDYSSVIINTVFLIACLALIKGFKLTTQDIGLKIVTDRLGWHVFLCLSIFLLYMAYYIFAVRISSLRPVTSQTWWGILNYIIVACAEEFYFRGILYGIARRTASERAALIVSTLLFGLAHARQGLGMIPKFFTGWLWGSVRYSTGMIFLLIIPIHLAYNVVWLLFQGNWENPPFWAQFLPIVELLLGTLIAVAHTRAARGKVPAE